MNLKFACNICKQNNWYPLYQDIVKCKYCGLVRSTDNFFKLEPLKLYDNTYYNGKDYLDYASEEAALTKNFRKRLAIIKKYKTNGKLLDIGCAYGFFVKTAKNNFKVEGVELDKQVSKIAARNSSCTIHTGFLPNLKLATRSFDVITMFDVIEHLKDPDKYIKTAYKLLRKNGILVIETGNIDSLLAKIQKRKWRLIVPNVHLYYFSSKTLESILAKNGFEIIQNSQVGFYRTISQTIFRLTRTNLKLLKPILDIPFKLNSKDLNLIIAKK